MQGHDVHPCRSRTPPWDGGEGARDPAPLKNISWLVQVHAQVPTLGKAQAETVQMVEGERATGYQMKKEVEPVP